MRISRSCAWIICCGIWSRFSRSKWPRRAAKPRWTGDPWGENRTIGRVWIIATGVLFVLSAHSPRISGCAERFANPAEPGAFVNYLRVAVRKLIADLRLGMADHCFPVAPENVRSEIGRASCRERV